MGDEFFLFSAVTNAELSGFRDSLDLLKPFDDWLFGVIDVLEEVEVEDSRFFSLSILEKFEFFPWSVEFSEFFVGYREPSSCLVGLFFMTPSASSAAFSMFCFLIEKFKRKPTRERFFDDRLYRETP